MCISCGGQNRGDSSTLQKDPLSPRQKEVLTLIAIEGKTEKEIARQLGLSKETVDDYTRIIRQKYSVTKTVVAVAQAVKHGHINV